MDNNNDNLVTIITFTFAHELAIVRSILESEGIDCFVRDELTVQVNPLYSNAMSAMRFGERIRINDVCLVWF